MAQGVPPYQIVTVLRGGTLPLTLGPNLNEHFLSLAINVGVARIFVAGEVGEGGGGG